MTSIEAAICERLEAELMASPGSDVQGVWQLIVEQSADTPAVRVQLIDEVKPAHLRGPAGMKFARVQTDVYVGMADDSDPYGLSTDIMEAIEAALQPEPFEAGGSPPEIEVRAALPQGRQPFFVSQETKQIGQSQDFFVWWRRMN